MTNNPTNVSQAVSKVREAYRQKEVQSAMAAEWNSILALSEEPFEALYIRCDLEAGIRHDDAGWGGFLQALDNDVLFVALTTEGVQVYPVPHFAQPRDLTRPPTPALVGFVQFKSRKCIGRPFSFWQQFGLEREAALVCKIAGKQELGQALVSSSSAPRFQNPPNDETCKHTRQAGASHEQRSQLHKDAQPGVRVMLPIDEATQAAMEAHAIIHCYEDAQQRHANAYMVKVETGERVFMYPISIVKSIPDTEAAQRILGHVRRQHELYERPRMTRPPAITKITPDIVRQLKANMHVVTNRGRGVCDFCNEPRGEGYRVYDAGDFTMINGHLSVGAWCACSVCAQFIEGEDWDGLAHRMTEVNNEGVPKDKMAYLLELNQQQVRDFRQHRLYHKYVPVACLKQGGKNPRAKG